MNKRLTICAEDIIETAKLGISEADKIAKIRALVAKFTESCVPNHNTTVLRRTRTRQ